MHTVQAPNMNALRLHRSALTRCAGILLKPAVITMHSLHRSLLMQPEQHALPQPQQFGCLLQRSVTSFSAPRFVIACANATDSMESE